MRLLVAALALGIVGCSDPGPSDIRVKNGSQTDFQNVVLGGKTFGDIKSGAVTGYQSISDAYGTESIKLKTKSMDIDLVPIDHVGERPLGKGRFTFILSFHGEQLHTQVERD